MNRFAQRAAVLLAGLAMVACDRGQGAGEAPPGATVEATRAQPQTTPAPPPAVQLPKVELADVVETTSDYIIGISYPQSAGKYPLLAKLLKDYAAAARADLMQAVAARPADAQPAMYDLSLSFTEVLDTPALVAYAADGSSYTGGAHGVPLVERFVWLPQQRERLTASALVPDQEAWVAISKYVRERLHAALSQRADAAQLPPGQRAALIDSVGDIIKQGTAPDPALYAQFEPVAGANGKLVALRFAFPPYQVAPYSGGTRSVEVPASILLPHVAPQFRPLFAHARSRPPSAQAQATSPEQQL